MAVEGDNTMILWAKPDETLHDHTRRVVESGRWLAKRLQLSGDLRQRVELACILHDVGKATYSFQKRMEAARTGAKSSSAYPHALASFPFMLAIESQRFGQSSPKIAAAAVLTHHSPLHPRLYEGIANPPDFIEHALREWLAQWLPNEVEVLMRLLNENPSAWLHQEANYPDGSRTLMQQFQHLPVPEFTLVKALLCLADWLASSHQEPKTIFLTRGKQKLLCHLQLKKGLALNCLYQFQRDAEARRDSRLYLQAPTGAGKTEAMLLFAGDSERILYLLPTQATANAMHTRLAAIYGRDAVGIAHGHALLELSRDGEEPPLDVRLFNTVFAKPVTVATLDQYLLTHLHGRHWEIRRTLSRYATVLMDEIHAYEPYTLGLLHAALEADPPQRLAIASATLPTPLMKYLGNAPLVKAEDSLWQQRRHRLLREQRAPEKAVKEALDHAANGEAVLFVVNTVPMAQSLYQVAAEQARLLKHPPEVHLLHARFVYRDRRRKEQQLRRLKRRALVIATQVVEVSLDISYHRLYTELAPLDALVQRMGRVNRYGTLPQPASVHILLEYDPRSERVYGKDLLHETQKLLQQLPEQPTNMELTDATDTLYQTVWQSQAFQEELKLGETTLEEVQSVLGCFTVDLTDEEMQRRFCTRRGVVSVDVLPLPFLQEAYELRQRRTTWRLPELLVSVPYWWTTQFRDYFMPCADLGVPITSLPYDAFVGLSHPTTVAGSVDASLEVY
jgi:CRISPR-associated endonuclease/helicase Cas3